MVCPSMRSARVDARTRRLVQVPSVRMTLVRAVLRSRGAVRRVRRGTAPPGRQAEGADLPAVPAVGQLDLDPVGAGSQRRGDIRRLGVERAVVGRGARRELGRADARAVDVTLVHAQAPSRTAAPTRHPGSARTRRQDVGGPAAVAGVPDLDGRDPRAGQSSSRRPTSNACPIRPVRCPSVVDAADAPGHLPAAASAGPRPAEEAGRPATVAPRAAPRRRRWLRARTRLRLGGHGGVFHERRGGAR